MSAFLRENVAKNELRKPNNVFLSVISKGEGKSVWICCCAGVAGVMVGSGVSPVPYWHLLPC